MKYLLSFFQKIIFVKLKKKILNVQWKTLVQKYFSVCCNFDQTVEMH